jgi:nitroreductase
MELFEAIAKRRSIRSFRSEAVPDYHLEEILRTGTLAPSAGNTQPWEFVVTKKDEKKLELAEAAFQQSFIAEAPVVVTICANEERSAHTYSERGRRLYCIQDTAAAVENMLLAATALGYGACWIGAFDENKVRKALGIPPGVRPVALLPVGIPAEMPEARSRRELGDVIHAETYAGAGPS